MPLTLSQRELDSLFPALIDVGFDGRIRRVGPSLRRVLGANAIGADLFDTFTFERPAGVATIERLINCHGLFHLRCRAHPELLLKGVTVLRTRRIVILASYALTFDGERTAPPLRFEDFSPTNSSLEGYYAAQLSRSLLEDVGKMAEEVESARAAAEAESRAKSDLIANISHEIRTPLNGVVAMSHQLRDANLDAATREKVDLIVDGADVLQRLVNDLIDLARIEAMRLDVANAPFQPADAVRAVVGLFGARAQEKGLTLAARIDPAADRWITGDATRLRQIVANLVSNAIKFTSEGGVLVDVRLVERGDAATLAIDVADTGVGIRAADAEQLFNRFTQFARDPTQARAGAGLGLFISRALAELMGGRLTAESIEGKGSLFRLRIPARACAAAPQIEPAETAALPRGFRVLVADDHPRNIRVMEIVLAEADAQVVTARNGLEALQQFEQGHFDLVLIDLEMPVMDGLTAIERIRAFERFSGRAPTSIVSVSAHAMGSAVKRALAAGADLCVSKPFTAASLFQAIASIRAAERPPAIRVA